MQGYRDRQKDLGREDPASRLRAGLLSRVRVRVFGVEMYLHPQVDFGDFMFDETPTATFVRQKQCPGDAHWSFLTPGDKAEVAAFWNEFGIAHHVG